MAMSGFVGVFRRDGADVDDGCFEEMLDRIAHRGPDGSGAWRGGSVALGHQQFHTTAESKHVGLPVTNDDESVALTGDVRLDNRAELIDQLSIDDAAVADEEVLLAAYERWGRRCPEMLVGPFSFVVWDGNESRLVCARDHLGVKPFYYAVHDDCVVVGSEAKSVLAHRSVPDTVDEVRIGEYLASVYPDYRRSFYEAVSRLPPAHVLTVEADGVTEHRYWRLDDEREIRLESDAAYAREFRRRFDEAVRCRLRGIDTPAIELSGGLDSSSVAGVVRQAVDGPVYTFSNRFESPAADEREYLEAVLGGGDFTAHSIDGDRTDPLHELSERVRFQDGPIRPAMFWHSWISARTVSENGFRVLLDGWGGDQVASHGYARLRELAATGQWYTLLREMRALRAKEAYPYRSQLWREVIGPLAPGPARSLWQAIRSSDVIAKANPALRDGFVRQIGLTDHLRKIRDESTNHRTHRSYHAEDVTSPAGVRMLELIDRVSARHSIERRHPFVDRRLVEFCVGMPPAQKRRNGMGRFAMRNAMVDVLPEPVFDRTSKADFGQPFADALAAKLAGVHPGIEEFSEAIRYLDQNELDEMARRVREDHHYHDAQRLACAYSLERWLRSRKSHEVDRSVSPVVGRIDA